MTVPSMMIEIPKTATPGPPQDHSWTGPPGSKVFTQDDLVNSSPIYSQKMEGNLILYNFHTRTAAISQTACCFLAVYEDSNDKLEKF